MIPEDPEITRFKLLIVAAALGMVVLFYLFVRAVVLDVLSFCK